MAECVPRERGGDDDDNKVRTDGGGYPLPVFFFLNYSFLFYYFFITFLTIERVGGIVGGCTNDTIFTFSECDFIDIVYIPTRWHL